MIVYFTVTTIRTFTSFYSQNEEKDKYTSRWDVTHAGSTALHWLRALFLCYVYVTHTDNTKNSRAYQKGNIPMEIFWIHNSDFILRNCKYCHLNEHTKDTCSSKRQHEFCSLFKIIRNFESKQSRIKRGTFPVATNFPLYFQNRNIQGSKHFYSPVPQVRVLLVSLPSELSNQKISLLPVYIISSLIWNSSQKVTYMRGRTLRGTEWRSA